MLIALLVQTAILGTAALGLKRLVLLWQRKREPETRYTVLGIYGAAAVVTILLAVLSR